MRLFRIIVLVFATCAPLLSQAQGLTAEVVNQDSLRADPGGFVTLVYRLHSQSRDTLSVSPALKLPTGWSLATRTVPLTLAPRASTVGFLTFRVSPLAGSGRHPFDLVLQGTGIRASASFSVLIRPSYGLDMEVALHNEYVAAGDTVRFPIEVFNLGNGPADIELSPRSVAGGRFSLETHALTVQAGASQIVWAELITAADIRVETTYPIYVGASVRGERSAFVAGTGAAHAVPSYDNTTRAQSTVPIDLLLRSAGDELGSTGLLGASGSTRFKGGTVTLDVLAASNPRLSMLGSRDRYHASWTRGDNRIQLGDHSESVSPLTSEGMAGTGFGLRAASGRFSFRGTSVVTRHTFPRQQLQAAAVGYQALDWLNASMGAMNRSGLHDGSVVTARVMASPIRGSQLVDVECGLDGSGLAGTSCVASATLVASRASYQGKLEHTAPTYPGARSNSSLHSNRLVFRASRSMRFDATMTRSSQDYTLGYRRESSQNQLGLALSKLASGRRLFLNAGVLRQTQLYEGPTTRDGLTQNTARLQSGMSSSRSSLHGTVEVGTSEGIATGRKTPSFRSTASLRQAFGWHLNFWLNGEYASNRVSDRSPTTSRWSLSARTQWTSGRSQLSASILSNRILSQSAHQVLTFRMEARHTFAGNHKLSFVFQRSSFGATGSAAMDYRVSYSVPLGIPVAGDGPEDLFVTGRVFDADTGAGMADVLLFVGDTPAITDGNGRFRALRPAGDRVFLRVDQKSIGLERIPLVSLPLELNSGSEAAFLDIPVSQSGRVQGVVEYWGVSNGEPLLGSAGEDWERTGPATNMVFELLSGTFRYRVRSDGRGRFTFNNVAPGTYSLTPVTRIPDRTKLDPPQLTVEVSGGATQSVSLRIIPAAPKMRLVDTGQQTLTLGPTPAGDKTLSAAKPATDSGRTKAKSALPDPTQKTKPANTLPAERENTEPAVNPPAEAKAPLDRADSTTRDNSQRNPVSAERHAADPSDPGNLLQPPEWVEGDESNPYTVVVGSTLEKAVAQAVLDRMQGIRLGGTILEFPDGGRTRYRVALGQFKTFSLAAEVIGRLGDMIPEGSWVLRYGAK